MIGEVWKSTAFRVIAATALVGGAAVGGFALLDNGKTKNSDRTESQAQSGSKTLGRKPKPGGTSALYDALSGLGMSQPNSKKVVKRTEDLQLNSVIVKSYFQSQHANFNNSPDDVVPDFIRLTSGQAGLATFRRPGENPPLIDWMDASNS